jgi:hypothetical protein
MLMALVEVEVFVALTTRWLIKTLRHIAISGAGPTKMPVFVSNQKR